VDERAAHGARARRRGLISMDVIDSLRAGAQKAPSATALVDSVQEISYRTLLCRVIQAAALLESAGSRVVGLLADNSADWVIADLAALEAGMTIVPVPPYFTGSQRRHLLDASNVDTLIIDAALAGSGESGHEFGSLDGTIGDLRLLRRRVTVGHDASPPAATAKITFTSGSTGQPRGVCLSFDTIADVSGRLRALFDPMAIERHLCVTPLATLLENIAGVHVPLMLGATVHVPSLSTLGLYGSSRIDAGRFARTIESACAESLILQPELLRALTAVYRDEGRRNPDLRYVAVGGAKVSEGDLEAAAAVGIPACQGYGLSECASVVALNRPGDSRSGSVGRPLPGLSVTVDDSGEILVHNQCMLGYLDDDSRSSEFVATGDIGHLDEDGFLYVTGRRKNVFITSFGRNVSPEWPESELLHTPEIAQACVFGEGQPANTAIIVPSARDVTATDIESAVRCANRNLPDYAQVSDWVIASEPFSRANDCLTATGKPRRGAIAARYLGCGPTNADIDARSAAGMLKPNHIPTRTNHELF
jgi:long-subunit acyl-CoA synthetase (AMP-forming)